LDSVLGVDGGNTKTIALVARIDGTITGIGRDGCSDIYGAASAEAAVEATTSAVEAALQAAGIRPSALAAGVFSMAGADWPEDMEFVESAMTERGFGRRVIVVNDAMGALRAGSPDGTGVVVVCGTGAATGARAPGGRAWHTSFWQDTQGSRHLALKALEAIYRAELYIEPSTTLTARVLEIFDRSTVEEVLHLFTARHQKPPRDLSRVTSALLEEAAGGDSLAGKIVHDHGAALGDYAVAAARRVGIIGTPFTLVLAGGVLRHPGSSILTDAIVSRVRITSPQACPVMSRFEPVVGALLLALEAAGISVGEPLLRRVQATLPPSSHFVT